MDIHAAIEYLSGLYMLVGKATVVANIPAVDALILPVSEKLGMPITVLKVEC